MPYIPQKTNLNQFIKKEFSAIKGSDLLTAEGFKALKLLVVDSKFVQYVRSTNNNDAEIIVFFADNTVQELCRVNQYFSFNAFATDKLKSIYKSLINMIRLLNNDFSITQLNEIEQQYLTELQHWLIDTNPFAEKLYANNEEFIQPVACSEYAPELQLELFHMQLKDLKEPLLDVGCGKEMNLLYYLRSNNLEAFGIDRFEIKNKFYIKTDWLEYNFEPQKWGTIISNLGFSNHFFHHNLRVDGNYRAYAQKYMEILQSLKYGASFYYAPSLPFIEMHLDAHKYSLTTFPIAGYKFTASKVTKI